jgi:hypothetical protein
MKGASVVGIVHLFFCGCVSVAYVGEREALLYTYCGSYLFQILASFVVYTGGNSLQQRTALGWVRWAAIIALVNSALALLLALPLLVRALGRRHDPTGDDAFFLGVILLLNGAVVVSFLVAGVKALLALRRPGVRRVFRH